MRIEQIKYILHVAESGSITRSAETLNISQQGLSHSIRQLERELSAKLLYREGNRTKLTAMGKQVRSQMEAIVHNYELMLETLSDNTNMDFGSNRPCRIHTTPHFCISAMQTIIRRMGKLYPKLLLNVMESSFLNILNSPTFDVEELFIITCPERLVSTISSRPGVISFCELSTNPVEAVLSVNHPLAEKDYIDLDDLCRYPLLLYGNDIQLLRSIATNRLCELDIRLQTTNFELYRNTLGSDNTIAFSIPLAFDLMSNPHLRRIPLEQSENIVYGYIVNEYVQNSHICQELLNLLEHELHKLIV